MAAYKRNMVLLKNVGDNIRKYRNLKGLTYAQLAHKTDIDQSSLWDYENARASPNLTNLDIIATALEVKAYQFLMDYEE